MDMEEVLVLFGIINGAVSLMIKEIDIVEATNEQK